MYACRIQISMYLINVLLRETYLSPFYAELNKKETDNSFYIFIQHFANHNQGTFFSIDYFPSGHTNKFTNEPSDNNCSDLSLLTGRMRHKEWITYLARSKER
jgi:hypothetical protein